MPYSDMTGIIYVSLAEFCLTKNGKTIFICRRSCFIYETFFKDCKMPIFYNKLKGWGPSGLFFPSCIQNHGYLYLEKEMELNI